MSSHSDFEEQLPPGTQRIEDSTGTKLLLAPQPNADPNQPLNWSTFRKAVHMILLCFYAIMVFAILCVAVPLWQVINAELGFSYETLNYGYAANMAGLSVGCIFFVPVALKYGRRPIYILTGLIMFAAAVWQAKMEKVSEMLVVNVITGLAGAVNEALFSVTVSDLCFVHQRGTINGIFLAIIITGNYLAPVASGYVAISPQGWRWSFWYCAIFMGVVNLALIFFLEETKYTPLVLSGMDVTTNPSDLDDATLAKVSSTSKERVGSVDIHATETNTNERRRVVEIDTSIPMNPLSKRLAFWNSEKQASEQKRSLFMHIYQPWVILVTFPAVAFAALQYGFLIAMLAILAVVQATLLPLEPYNFSTAGIGNMNIPPAIGAIIGAIIGGPLNDYLIVQIAKRRKGIYEPETRLWLFLIPGICMPIGLFLFGLTIAKGMAWQYNAVGAGFVGVAIGGCGDITVTYCQDCYQHILGDALTSVVFVRNILSMALVFALTPWMTGMGVYNMFVLLGCLSIAIALTCVPFIIWGRQWRIKFAPKYAYYAAKQF